MFLKVPATIRGMEPNESERRDLAQRVTAERKQRHGTRIAAYVAAGVNSATWSKVESGEPVSERSLIVVLKHLWPDTGGDWQRLVPPLGNGSTLRDQILQSDLSDEARAQMLAILDAERPEPPTPGRERGVS